VGGWNLKGGRSRRGFYNAIGRTNDTEKMRAERGVTVRAENNAREVRGAR
jgi:hypothetical protein